MFRQKTNGAPDFSEEIISQTGALRIIPELRFE